MKHILVTVNGQFYKIIGYRNKTECKANFRHFCKYGIVDPNNGLRLLGAEFKLISGF